MGPIMLDVSGYELTAEEKNILDHPLVGGVILFSRNYFEQTQLTELIKQIRLHARNPVLLAVDHEGGRVQRFRQGFSAIPAMAKLCPEDRPVNQKMCQQAEVFGWLMAVELLAFDIDISFAPVLDIHGISDVIGDRSFNQDPDKIIELASSFIQGMHRAGMKATGKHFPGHGNVKEDSHIAMPIDNRSLDEIVQMDMRVFKQIHQRGLLDAVMPAHVIYPQVDDLPAGFSPIWVQEYLRQQLGFNGTVFTDDLSMQGAVHLGTFVQRAEMALAAGCDMALVCNHPQGAIEVLDGLSNDYPSTGRVKNMLKGPAMGLSTLQHSKDYNQAIEQLKRFNES
ncbi:beta-N-acetylhexosaminidase [Aliiglaciecola sp. LCG003]|uniref:beta-N-acetylhexosaminidase n=1 Tax=Aliiglaciecola sp. LCG003 TaxID=3053655 RepID=UPI002574479C|nr:beta-N-acetylhexosaminidase [Aliiglaciecola sp. LCG003]WJG07943.1 beta-N-acetylhexosaminidase [Aliiglaciecola sp. LCG003]